MKNKLPLSTATALVLAFQPLTAHAAVSPDAIAADLQAQGYAYIQITQGPTQSLVEATMGDITVLTIIDNETGEVLLSETEAADPENIDRTGVATAANDSDDGDAEEASGEDGEGDGDGPGEGDGGSGGDD